MTTNERIRQLRHALHLSQAKFAKEILISNGYIAGIELGHRRANDRIIKLICTTYGASAHWLMTGEGEMFTQMTSERLEKAVTLFKELKPDFQDYVLDQLGKLLEIQGKLEYAAREKYAATADSHTRRRK